MNYVLELGKQIERSREGGGGGWAAPHLWVVVQGPCGPRVRAVGLLHIWSVITLQSGKQCILSARCSGYSSYPIRVNYQVFKI